MLLYIKQLQRSFVKTSCAKAFQVFRHRFSVVMKFITVSQYLKSQFLFCMLFADGELENAYRM